MTATSLDLSDQGKPPAIVRFVSALLISAGCFLCAESAHAQAPATSTNLTSRTDWPDTLSGSVMPPEPGGWQLVWSDDFIGSSLDPAKWQAEESCWGGGNNEWQCYTDRSENISLADGLLRITARKEEWTGPSGDRSTNSKGVSTKPYTSGKIITRHLSDWTYGRISARMKLPRGQGTWPAFWMMPSEDYYGGWPLSGEIDIMEAVNLGAPCPDCGSDGVESRIQGALHYGGRWPENKFTHQRESLPDGGNPADTFNVYSVEWGQGLIRWYVNEKPFFEMTEADWYTDADGTAERPQAPFDRPFYLILNLAVGGNLAHNQNAGGVDEKAFPAEFLVDWVRVYQCREDLETGLACMR